MVKIYYFCSIVDSVEKLNEILIYICKCNNIIKFIEL